MGFCLFHGAPGGGLIVVGNEADADDDGKVVAGRTAELGEVVGEKFKVDMGGERLGGHTNKSQKVAIGSLKHESSGCNPVSFTQAMVGAPVRAAVKKWICHE